MTNAPFSSSVFRLPTSLVFFTTALFQIFNDRFIDFSRKSVYTQNGS